MRLGPAKALIESDGYSSSIKIISPALQEGFMKFGPLPGVV